MPQPLSKSKDIRDRCNRSISRSNTNKITMFILKNQELMRAHWFSSIGRICHLSTISTIVLLQGPAGRSTRVMLATQHVAYQMIQVSRWQFRFKTSISSPMEVASFPVDPERILKHLARTRKWAMVRLLALSPPKDKYSILPGQIKNQIIWTMT